MKKTCTTKNLIKDEHKKRHISEIRKPKLKRRNHTSLQHTHNALKTQKSVAVNFKDVKTEETFSSQDQKPVKTTNL